MLAKWATVVAVAVCLIAGPVRAQSWEVGVGLGGFVYKGDIAPNFSFRNTMPAGAIIIRRNVSHAFTLRANAAFGSLSSDDDRSADPFQQARNISFRTRVAEASLIGEYNFLNYSSLRKVKNWTPYVFGGVGLLNSTLRNVGGLPRRIMVPLGVGVKYEFKRPWSVGVEFGTRFTSTDYLDGLGPATFDGTNKLQQGNPALKDKYTFVGFTLTYTFYKIDCPEQ